MEKNSVPPFRRLGSRALRLGPGQGARRLPGSCSSPKLAPSLVGLGVGRVSLIGLIFFQAKTKTWKGGGGSLQSPELSVAAL